MIEITPYRHLLGLLRESIIINAQLTELEVPETLGRWFLVAQKTGVGTQTFPFTEEGNNATRYS